MNLTRALQSLFIGRRPAAEAAPEPDAGIAGVSFPALEPELSKELHLTGRDISGWSMGGSSLSD